MELKINNVIINELIKEKNGDPDIFMPEEELNIEDKRLISIINSLLESFHQKTEKKAIFDKTGFVENDFFQSQAKLRTFANEQTRRLSDLVSSTSATGGYIVFCTYKKKHDFMSIFIIRNKKSTSLTRQNNSWDLSSILHLDTKNFAMGCKINISLYNDRNSSDRYISFIKGNTEIAEYFKSWVGITEEKSETKDFDSLLHILSSIDLPQQVESNIELKRLAHQFIVNKNKKEINVRELSNFLYDDELKISSFAERKGIDLSGEL